MISYGSITIFPLIAATTHEELVVASDDRRVSLETHISDRLCAIAQAIIMRQLKVHNFEAPFVIAVEAETISIHCSIPDVTH